MRFFKVSLQALFLGPGATALAAATGTAASEFNARSLNSYPLEGRGSGPTIPCYAGYYEYQPAFLPGSWACGICLPGTYSNGGYGTSCTPCPTGSTSGAVASSCTCPANTYWSAGACLSCPGAPSGSKTCTQPSGGVSPTRRRDTLLSASSCKRGEMLCPIYSGRGGMECVDVERTTDSCGGCVALPDDEPEMAYNGASVFTGRDCTAIPNVGAVGCWHGQCLVESCKKPYQLVDGACV